MLKFRASRLAPASVLARNPGFAANTSLRRNLKSALVCGALAMAGLAQAGSLTVTASGASAALSLNGNGISNGFVFSPTISADTSNYNLKAAALSAGWDGTTKLTANITINSGVVVSANNATIPAFDTGTGFPGGSTISLTNSGYVIGMGGAGGYIDATAGSGGPALRAQYPMTVNNTGTIGGGGGGGAGCFSGGGGGRTGRTNSPGGLGFTTYGGPTGNPGTFSAAGAAVISGTPGGAGGDFGATGFSSGCTVSQPGAGGAAVIGNANITWNSTGTRLGTIN